MFRVPALGDAAPAGLGRLSAAPGILSLRVIGPDGTDGPGPAV